MSDLFGYVVWDDNRKRYALEFGLFRMKRQRRSFRVGTTGLCGRRVGQRGSLAAITC